MLKSALILCPAALLLVGVPIYPAYAQKAPGNYPACSVDNPPNKCSDNMYVEIVTALAPNTGQKVDTALPGCGPGPTKDYIQAAVNAIKDANSEDKFKNLSGNLFTIFQGQVADVVIKNTGGDVHNFLKNNGPKRSDANCVPVAAFIPASADLVGVRTFVHDIDAAAPDHWGGCPPPPGECSLNWSRYVSRPEQISSDGGKAVVTTFANWSDDRRRVAHMYVFYTMPSGEKPVPYI